MEVSLVDTDGDTITFRLSDTGVLQEFVNGELEISEMLELSYNATDCCIRDDTGEFNLRASDFDEKILALQALASHSGVHWRWEGEQLASVAHVSLIDADGDRIDYVLVTETGELQMFCNGELEVQAVHTLAYFAADGTIRDDTGVFKLQVHEQLEKVVALHALAQCADVSWLGDDPVPSSVTSFVDDLDIENCDQFQEQCPRSWGNLHAMATPHERHCEICQEIVYLCSALDQVQDCNRRKRCVAFDLMPLSGCTGSAQSARVDTNTNDEEVDIISNDKGRGTHSVSLRVWLLSGEQLPEIRFLPDQSILDIKAALAHSTSIPANEQRLTIGDRELKDNCTLAGEGLDSMVTLQLTRVRLAVT